MFKNVILILSAMVVMTSCASGFRNEFPKTKEERDAERIGKLGGGDGLFSFGFGKGDKQADGSGVAVNGFLWQSSLDVVHKMPISSIDPHAGVIMTDWYQPAGSDGRARYKLNIFIVSSKLVSDGVKVSAFRQEKQANGSWGSEVLVSDLSNEIEERILYRARELKVGRLD